MGFKAGFGTADITPDFPVTMSGFAIRTGHNQGVHDRLCARAIALDDGTSVVCLLILDVIGVSASLTRRLRDTFAKLHPESELVCLATHTHGAPAVLDNAYLGSPDEAFLTLVEQQSLQALQTALSSRQACTLHYGVHQEPSIAHNRRDPQGIIDSDVSVLRFQAGKQCLGLLVSYACHPVVLGPQNQLLTRDYPGYLLDELATYYPDATTLFATGCAGQINTGHLATDSWRHDATHKRTFVEAERIGKLLAVAAYQASEAASKTPPLSAQLGLAKANVALALDSDYAPTPETLSAWQQQASSKEPEVRLLADIRLQWAKQRQQLEEVITELCVLRLGALAVAIFPGEPFVDYALYFKKHYNTKQGNTPVLALAYGNDNPGYLPTAQAYKEGGYEVADAFTFYGLPAPFTPALEPSLQAAMTTLLKEVGVACL